MTTINQAEMHAINEAANTAQTPEKPQNTLCPTAQLTPTPD